MKNTLSGRLAALTISVLSLALFAACGQKTGSERTTKSRTSLTQKGTLPTLSNPTQTPNTTSSNGVQWGQVQVTANTNQIVHTFFSQDDVTLGNLSSTNCMTASTSPQPCAIFFSVTQNSSPFAVLDLTSAGGNSMQIQEDGFITILFYDSLTGAPSNDGSGLPNSPVVATIPLNRGNAGTDYLVPVNGSGAAYLTFGDDEGSLQLGYAGVPGGNNGSANPINGSMSGTQFSGQMTFINNNAQGAVNSLGAFQIGTCAIFHCY